MVTINVHVPREAADATSDLLEAAGALAVTMSDAGVGAQERPVYEPGVGETPLWPRTHIEALFADQASAAAAWRTLDPELRDTATTGALQERDWVRAWLDRFQPQRFGERLWICPREVELPAHAKAGGAGRQPVVVRLDPGLAFGTGNHATTALCLEWLDALEWGAANGDARRVLDFGCGSGILAIAALMLGAREALAVDHDPQAVTATLANAADNNVAGRLQAGMPSRAEGARCGVIVANILAKPLVELAPVIAGLAIGGAQLAVSGILAQHAAAVAAAYEPWFDWRDERERDGWMLLSGVRRIEV